MINRVRSSIHCLEQLGHKEQDEKSARAVLILSAILLLPYLCRIPSSPCLSLLWALYSVCVIPAVISANCRFPISTFKVIHQSVKIKMASFQILKSELTRLICEINEHTDSEHRYELVVHPREKQASEPEQHTSLEHGYASSGGAGRASWSTKRPQIPLERQREMTRQRVQKHRASQKQKREEERSRSRSLLRKGEEARTPPIDTSGRISTSIQTTESENPHYWELERQRELRRQRVRKFRARQKQKATEATSSISLPTSTTPISRHKYIEKG